MSVVAWDGTTLATDLLGSDGVGMVFPHAKIRRAGAEIHAWTGANAVGRLLSRWREGGAKASEWPAVQSTDNWSRLIVVTPAGGVYHVISYEIVPEPAYVLAPFFAWGAGSEFAIGAMEMGADAEAAVRVACKWSMYCGFGVQSIKAGGNIESSVLETFK